jgi:hypothetical protein
VLSAYRQLCCICRLLKLQKAYQNTVVNTHTSFCTVQKQRILSAQYIKLERVFDKLPNTTHTSFCTVHKQRTLSAQYIKLERVFDKLPKYHIKILLGNFNAKVDREDILKTTLMNVSIHKICNDI